MTTASNSNNRHISVLLFIYLLCLFIVICFAQCSTIDRLHDQHVRNKIVRSKNYLIDHDTLAQICADTYPINIIDQKKTSDTTIVSDTVIRRDTVKQESVTRVHDTVRVTKTITITNQITNTIIDSARQKALAIQIQKQQDQIAKQLQEIAKQSGIIQEKTAQNDKLKRRIKTDVWLIIILILIIFRKPLYSLITKLISPASLLKK